MSPVAFVLVRCGVLTLVAALLASAGSVARAQTAPTQRCVLEFEGSGTRSNAVRLPSGNYNFFQGGGVTYRCKGQDVTLIADSAEYYADANVLILIDNVHYREPRVRVNSRRMTYWRLEDRLLAEGDVDAMLPSGTTLRGPQVEYWRPIPGVRPQSRMVATGRPRMQLVERSPGAAADARSPEPVLVVANQLVMQADSLVYASGKVEISRPDMMASGDSAFMDRGTEFARLMRDPVIDGRRGRPFTLRGRVIDVFSRQRRLERVLAYTSAKATSDNLDLASDTIDLRVANDRMQRAYAWGPSRARVVSPERSIVADSLDVLMPEQRMREVRAVGRAFAETRPDSVKLTSTERDWLRGDTIVAHFDSTAADTTKRPGIRLLVAHGEASSFYQVPGETPAATPSLNYVRGRVITVRFEQQQVQTVTVLEQAVGLYLEPKPPPAPAPAPAQTPSPTPAPAVAPPPSPGVTPPGPEGRPRP